MKAYRIRNRIIPESAITGFVIQLHGKNSEWEETFEVGITTLDETAYLPPMTLPALELLLKTTFGVDVVNVAQPDPEDYEVF